jgi:hypothetical protein
LLDKLTPIGPPLLPAHHVLPTWLRRRPVFGPARPVLVAANRRKALSNACVLRRCLSTLMGIAPLVQMGTDMTRPAMRPCHALRARSGRIWSAAWQPARARALPVSQGGLRPPQATSTARPATKGRDGCGCTTAYVTKHAVSAPLDSSRRTQKQTSASAVPLAHLLLQPLRVARIASRADTATTAARTSRVSTAHRTPIPLMWVHHSARAVSVDGSLTKRQCPQTTALCRSGRTWAATLKAPASKPLLRTQ